LQNPQGLFGICCMNVISFSDEQNTNKLPVYRIVIND